MAAKAKCDAVLMIGFGGPTRADEVRPFLDNVLRGRPIPRERYEEVVHHYDLLGGRSPYNDLTMRQAAALRAHLQRKKRASTGRGRNAQLDAVHCRLRLRALAEGGDAAASLRRSSWRRIAARRASSATRPTSTRRALRWERPRPRLSIPQPWHDDPLFVRRRWLANA